MKLRELLDVVSDTAKENKFSTPYIVGGFTRDLILKKIDDVKDIDITCGDESSLLLGQKLVQKLENSTLLTFSDGHSKLSYGNLSLDFSNNFKVPDIKNILKSLNVSDLKPIYEEIYSRDFTVNTLLLPLDLSTILDITGKGINDITNKLLDTCLAPEITLKNDPKRIIRIVYLCAKLGFNPHDRIVAWVQKNGQLLSKVNSKYMKTNINKAFISNKENSINLISLLNIEKYIPETALMMDALSGI